ncbi:MAG TPA: urea transporter [Flavobacteriales bacterium]|nr:urea transporter [Flavobacteriales bacterium]
MGIAPGTNWGRSLKDFGEGVLMSYAQVFFSQKRALAILLMLVTFVDFSAGLSGLTAVIITQLASRLLGLDHTFIRTGVYSFNSLSVGLCLGVYYTFNFPFLAILFLASLLCLLLTVWLYGVFSVKGLPFLSFPFIFTIWLILLAARSYDALELSERGIYNYNELFKIGGQQFVDIMMTIENYQLPFQFGVYFRSLGAVFFQYNLIVGVVAAIALLIYSRIAFTLSLLGFYTGYLFYSFVGGDINQLTYSYIGFNFILSAIAIGGFFLIPSKWSFLTVMIITPLIAVLNSGLAVALLVVQLPLYSMPFNIMVVLFLYLLRMRTWPRFIHLTGIQHYSPENNLYSFSTGLERFRNSTLVLMQLPFFGKWTVTQGHDGEHTHKKDWRHALDFSVLDEEGNEYMNNGLDLKDYYSFQKPVLAPADGLVVDIHANIEDNQPGDVNIDNNWGNSIVIKHGEHLYSQLSHLHMGSFRVSLGDYVRKGDILALLGNSGRSPSPHIHFQLQSTPYVGSPTLSWPISYYLREESNQNRLICFEIPKKDDTIQNIEINPLLKDAFGFVPGQVLKFDVEEGKTKTQVKWEVRVNIYNQAYIYCHTTGAYAYLLNNGTMFYFLSFNGDRKSLLYQFYLGAYQVLLGYYPDVILRDQLPVNTLRLGVLRTVQDFIAPFWQFLHVQFNLEYTEIDSTFNPRRMVLRSQVNTTVGGVRQSRSVFEIELNTNRISRFSCKTGSKRIQAFAVDELSELHQPSSSVN